MPSPAYHAPDTITGAIALLAADPSALPLGGGTDLIVQMRSGRIAPGAVIDLKRIEGMSGVRREGDVFVIGAATPCSALKGDAAFSAAWPGVVEAANLIGSVQVRNRATMAGNLCNASPAADSVPALVAAGATCVIAGPGGVRQVPVEAVPVAPGRTSLGPGEFVVEFRLPVPREGGGDAYLRATPRTEMDIAVVGTGVCLVLDAAGTCMAARVVLGAVGPTVMLVEEAGAALVGSRLDDDVLAAMSRAVQAASNPIDDKRGTVSYRKAMAGVLARRAALIAAGRAQAVRGISR
ncbi:carbon-monoxide dehydrogenase medium subunit [Novosphingobium sp. CF614]|uniref:FAD binding domain-containing protein n=1 Tax=Novosphingobium sp. CF614 TaxID=1884364 RepID=UPI0008F1006F|nr:xanthine dehydrogenase family protein subunit M [Novosphingobium sp. CF614]SFF84359.1 carbon-monoxide dehydrogenase medium subunit [Novosphingobium sp. CF614]